MTVQINNKTHATITIDPHWTGTVTGYRMAYLDTRHKHALRLPQSLEYAIRIDGSKAELVRVINGYTAHKYAAVIVG